MIVFFSIPKFLPRAVGKNTWSDSQWSTSLPQRGWRMYMGWFALSLSSISDVMLPLLTWWFRQRFFCEFPLLRRRGNYEPKKEDNMKKKSKAPTCGQLCRSQAITPFHHRGLYSNRTWPAVGTYGTCDCFLTPITPTGDHLAASHSTNNTHPHC